MKKRVFPFFLVLASIFFAFLVHFEASGAEVRGMERPLRVWFFDVGQGDAIFIETPTGEQILVDAGADNTVLAKLGAVMSPLDRTIDAILVTHPHEDHLAGFVEVLRRYDVGAVYETGAEHDVGTQAVFWEEVQKEGALHALVRGGKKIMLGDVQLEILAPDADLSHKHAKDPNLSSLVVRLTYGETSILLTGDAPIALEADFLSELSSPIDVLKVAHHGSAYSTSKTFLEITKPKVSIISVGKNSYGHPHPVLLARLFEAGIKNYRTDLDGDILLTSFGEEPNIEPHPLPF